jgi:hypothetical protein
MIREKVLGVVCACVIRFVRVGTFRHVGRSRWKSRFITGISILKDKKHTSFSNMMDESCFQSFANSPPQNSINRHTSPFNIQTAESEHVTDCQDRNDSVYPFDFSPDLLEYILLVQRLLA